MKNYLIVIEKSSTGYGAFSPDVLGCAVVAETVDETLRLIKEGLQFHLESMTEDGDDIPEPRPVEEHIATYRAEGVELNSAEFIWAFVPVEEVVSAHHCA